MLGRIGSGGSGRGGWRNWVGTSAQARPARAPRLARQRAERGWADRGWGAGETLEVRIVPTRLAIEFDYSLDTGNFFADPARRALLDQAADIYEQRLTDELSAIVPSGGNTWDAVMNDPSGTGTKTVSSLTIPMGTLRVFVGSQTFGSSTLAVGGPGGYNANGDVNWLNLVAARGQAGALVSPNKDFGPWGGSISFSTTTNWSFGSSSTVPAGKTDFLSVAIHELGHVLGIGTIESFTSKVTSQQFTGAITQLFSSPAGPVPVTGDASHWAASVQSDGQQAIMIPTIPAGRRLDVTSVDWAALQDIGWQVGDRMYRAYNIERDFHFFTQNKAEFQAAVAGGLRDENTSQTGFSVTSETLPNSSPLYRLYNPNKGSHYYTLSAGERDFLVSVGLTSEGTVGRLFTTQVPGTKELFRLYNLNSGVHLFTIEASVKTAVLAAFPGIWVQHDSVGFAFVSPGSNAAGVPGGGSALAELSPSLPPQVQSVQMAPYVHDEHDHEDEGEPGENATLTSLLLVVQPATSGAWPAAHAPSPLTSLLLVVQPATGWVGSWSVSSDVDDELPVGPVNVVAEETDVEAGLLADAVFAELGWLWDGERVG